jgi:hypothetical protein
MRRIPTTHLPMLTLLAILAICASIAPLIGFRSYLSPVSWSDADIIRHYHSIRLLSPDCVSPAPSTLLNWTYSEILARVGAVSVVWSALFTW